MTCIIAKALTYLAMPWFARPGPECPKCEQTITWHDFFNEPLWVTIDVTNPLPKRTAMEHVDCPPPRRKKVRRLVPQPHGGAA